MTWTIPDLIDFEHYLDVDERRLRDHPSARKSLIERDHGIYQDEVAPAVSRFQPHTLPHRRASLRGWLAARRNAEDPHLRPLLPGAAFGGAQRLVAIVIALVGLLLGYGVASALLSYDGTRPVGIAWYLFLLVGVQLGLVLSVVTAWGVRRMRGGGTLAPPSLLTHAVRPLLSKATQWLQGQRLGHATAELQEQVKAQHGVLKSQYALYGPVSYLPLLIQAQLFGVAFNLGVVLTTILLELFTDLAFGWGSTLNVHPQTIYDLTRLVALPWGWLFGEGVGYPSLEQVAGSRIILEHWATATPTIKPDPTHLRSWGSFLVLAVTTYGLLPRLLLLGGSIAARAYVLARLPFTHAGSQALYGRMLSPRLETTMGGTATVTEMPIPTPAHARGRRAGSPDAPTAPTPTEVSRPWRNALVRQGRGATPVTDVTPKAPPSVEVKPSAPVVAPPEPQARPAAEAPSARGPVTTPPAEATPPRAPEPVAPAARPAAEPEPVPRLFAKPKPAVPPAPEIPSTERPAPKPAAVERASVAAALGERPTGKPAPVERPPTVAPAVEPPVAERGAVEAIPPERPQPEVAPVEPAAVARPVAERAAVEVVSPEHPEPEVVPVEPPTVAPPVPEPVLVEAAHPESERPKPEVAPVEAPVVTPPVAEGALIEAAPPERPEPEAAPVTAPVVEPPVVEASAVVGEQPLEPPVAERMPAEVPQIQPPAVEVEPAERSVAPPSEVEQPAVEAASVEPPRVEVALTEQPETEPPGAGSLALELGPPPEPPPQPLPLVPTAPPVVGRAGGVRYAPDACLLLLHVDVDDVLEDEDRPRLEQMLLELTGWRVGTVATFGAGTAMNDEAIGMLEAGDWEAPPSRVALIEDGSQPPITESLRFLRELRQAAGTRAQILLALVGDPTDEDRLPPIRAFDFTDWQRKIDQMADPYLRLEMLAPPSEDGES